MIGQYSTILSIFDPRNSTLIESILFIYPFYSKTLTSFKNRRKSRFTFIVNRFVTEVTVLSIRILKSIRRY